MFKEQHAHYSRFLTTWWTRERLEASMLGFTPFLRWFTQVLIYTAVRYCIEASHEWKPSFIAAGQVHYSFLWQKGEILKTLDNCCWIYHLLVLSIVEDHSDWSWKHFSSQGFYTVHGDSALFIARIFYKTTSVIRYYGSEGKRLDPGANQNGKLASVALNQSLLENALRELLLEGSQHSVEMYEGTGCTWRLKK
jgi:hypothetical protein